MEVLGIDIGGSGIKGALVDIEKGEFVGERFRVETPKPANQEAFVSSIRQIIEHFSYSGPVGVGFPGVVQNGVIRTAANIAKSWVDVDAATLFKKEFETDFYIVNDADAAGVAEVKYGTSVAGQRVVLFMTIGTGIGTALFTDGKLQPNTELGHILLDNGLEAEHFTSDLVRKRDDLGWGKWGKRFNKFLTYMDALFWPDLIVVGGGTSKKFEKFQDKLDISQKTPIVPASLMNEAGIIGAAYFAYDSANK